MKLVRRLLPVAFCSLLATLAAPGEESRLDWTFKVLLDGKEIGTHTYRVEFVEDTATVETEASFQVKFLFFTAYTYLHRNTEVWDALGLKRIDAYTDANGDESTVRGAREDGSFQLQVNGESAQLPAAAWSFAYWNPEIRRQNRLLNAQTGEFEPVEVREQADADPVQYRDRSIPARRVDLIVKGLPVSVWYSVSDNRWLALESETKSGRMLTYVPQQLPPDAGPVVARFNTLPSYENTSISRD